MKEEIAIDTHKSVGPYGNMHGHGLVIFIDEIEEDKQDDDLQITESLCICLDCGFIDTDANKFAFEECNRKNNWANQTLREYLQNNELP